MEANRHHGYPVDVYTAPIPPAEIGTVHPRLRQQLLENTTHPGLKRQRYFVWKLLEHALKHSLGLELENLHFSCETEGKWTCRECFFSLSHRKNAVAVAVSRQPMGVDLECAAHTLPPGFAKKILTDRERQLPELSENENLLKLWCAKEALFKAADAEVFQPKSICALSGVQARKVTVGEGEYILAVAAKDLQNLRFYENIML